jgi:hypothetical protein
VAEQTSLVAIASAYFLVTSGSGTEDYEYQRGPGHGCPDIQLTVRVDLASS